MKTSNILIISFLVSIVAVMTLMQLVVKQKEKKKEFITQKELRKQMEETEFEVVSNKTFNSIKLEGIKNVFVAYSDNFKVFIRKTKTMDLTTRIENGELIFSAKQQELYEKYDDNIYYYEKDVIIYCPKFSSINANNSTFVVDSFPNTNSDSIDIKSKNSVLYLGNFVNDWDLEGFSEKPEFFFKNLNLTITGNGYFKLDPLVKVGNLSITSEGKPKIFVSSTLNFDSLKAHLSDSTIFKTTMGVIKAAKFN